MVALILKWKQKSPEGRWPWRQRVRWISGTKWRMANGKHPSLDKMIPSPLHAYYTRCRRHAVDGNLKPVTFDLWRDHFKPVHESAVLTLSLAWGLLARERRLFVWSAITKKKKAGPVKEWPDLSHSSPRSGDYESSSDSHSCSTRSSQLNHFSLTCSFFFHLPKCKISSKQRSKKVNHKKIKGC